MAKVWLPSKELSQIPQIWLIFLYGCNNLRQSEDGILVEDKKLKLIVQERIYGHELWHHI